MTIMTPFGLTFAQPVPERDRIDSTWAAARLDMDRQIAVLDGVALVETRHLGATAGSSPTETDGKDPIAVDSDPLYD